MNLILGSFERIKKVCIVKNGDNATTSRVQTFFFSAVECGMYWLYYYFLFFSHFAVIFSFLRHLCASHLHILQWLGFKWWRIKWAVTWFHFYVYFTSFLYIVMWSPTRGRDMSCGTSDCPKVRHQNPVWLGYAAGDNTTQLYKDYNKPLKGYLLKNQDDSWNVSTQGFDHCSPRVILPAQKNWRHLLQWPNRLRVRQPRWGAAASWWSQPRKPFV